MGGSRRRMQLSLVSDKKILSISRRTDPAWFPEKFCRVLQEKYPPERVHSIVIWTKHPAVLLQKPYRTLLPEYDQLYIHLTVTGLGGTEIEPNVPNYKDALSTIPDLITFVGSPDRIRLRPDPLIRVRKNGKVIDNLERAMEIIQLSCSYGIRNFSTSFCSPYPKVVQRLARHGFTLLLYSTEMQMEILNTLKKSSGQGVVHACCIPGAPVSRCIDGELLSRLHPQKEQCTTAKAKNQRELCGCTSSIDLGWYAMTCKSGCLYCYANPDQ